MPSLTIQGFQTKEQVKAFIDWYEGQGEQNASIWFECRKSDGDIDVDTMNMDMQHGVVWNEADATIKVKPR